MNIWIDQMDGTPPVEIKDSSFGDKVAVFAAGDYPLH